MLPLEILLSSIDRVWIGLAADYPYRVGVPVKGGIRIPPSLSLVSKLISLALVKMDDRRLTDKRLRMKEHYLIMRTMLQALIRYDENILFDHKFNDATTNKVEWNLAVWE